MDEVQKSIAKNDSKEKTEKVLRTITVIIVLYFIIYGGVLLDIIPWDKAKEFIYYLINHG
jgi:hypothetical protein